MESETENMSPQERRASVALAGIYALRMLGLFMILPVFALYAETLSGVTPVFVGLAIGVYGLTQALFQIPFGLLSDRVGRKPVITAGLIIFALGSVVAALSDSIWGVIAGRALQGTGAIAAAVMALTADLTREENRTKAMAMIGASIGMAFAFALVAGPVLDSWIGVQGIFWLTSVLAIGGIGVLLFLVPTPIHTGFHRDAEPVPAQFKSVLTNVELLRLDVGIFVLHMVLTATFVVVPLALRDNAGLAAAHHWWVYLPVLLVGMGLMVPFVIVAEKRRKMKQIFAGAVFALAISQVLLLVEYHSLAGIVLALLLFFTAFNVLEATLPSLIAKIAPPDKKGSAMGIYSSFQFIGAFTGGVSGGALYSHFGMAGVFAFCAAMLGVWFLIAMTMRSPRYLASYILKLGTVRPEQAKQLVMELTRITGVAEAVVIPQDGVAYLKVDNNALDKEALNKYRRQPDDGQETVEKNRGEIASEFGAG